MEASVVNVENKDRPLADALKALVGGEHVATGPDAAAPFLPDGARAPDLIRVCPASTEEVQSLVNLAREKRVPILTCYERHLLPEDLDRSAILLDFSRMNRICLSRTFQIRTCAC